jgi:hypothetical protein
VVHPDRELGAATGFGRLRGGVWGWGGVAVDPTARAGGVYAGTGNHKGIGGPTHETYAERIVNLNPDLSTISIAGPTIRPGDFDYGSTPVVFQPTGCKTKLLAVLNKTGLLVLASIGSDGTLTVLESLQISVGGHGNAAWDPVDQVLLLSISQNGVPPYAHGLNALRIASGCGPAPLRLAWQTTRLKDGTPFTGKLFSPTAANGLAWFGGGASNQRLIAVATTNGPDYSAGQILWQSRALKCSPMVAPPTVVNGHVYATCGPGGAGPNIIAFALP